MFFHHRDHGGVFNEQLIVSSLVKLFVLQKPGDITANFSTKVLIKAKQSLYS